MLSAAWTCVTEAKPAAQTSVEARLTAVNCARILVAARTTHGTIVTESLSKSEGQAAWNRLLNVALVLARRWIAAHREGSSTVKVSTMEGSK